MGKERGILHHLGFLSAAQAASQLLNAWALVFLAGFLGPHDFGIVQVGVAFLAYALITAEWGMMSLGVRDLARLDEPAARRSYARTQTGLLAVQAAVVLAVGWLALPLLPFTAPDPWVFRLYLLAVIPQVLHFWWIAAARERMDWVGVNRTALSLFYALAVLLVVPRLDGTAGIEARRWVPAAWLLAFAASNALLFAPVGRLLGGAVTLALPDGAEMRRRWREASSIGGGAIILRVLLNVDLILLGVLASPAAAGRYAAASRLMFLTVIATEVLWNALLPRLSRLYAVDPRRYRAELGRWLGLYAAALLPTVLLAVLAGPAGLTALLGAEFASAGKVLQVLAAAYSCLGLSSFLGRALIAENRQRLHIGPLAVGSLAAAAGCFAFVPGYGETGAAWSLAAAHGLVLLLVGRLFGKSTWAALGRTLLALAPAAALLAAALALPRGLPLPARLALGCAVYAAAAALPVRRLLRPANAAITTQ